MRIIGNDPSVPRQEHAVASGTLTNGSSVIVNSDGTVSVVAGSDTTSGTAVQFESGNINKPRSAYDTTNNRVVIAYADLGNSYYGTAVVGTVSGTSISFGTPAVFNSAQSNGSMSIVFDDNAGKVVISYQDGGTNQGESLVGTVSGTSISFGSTATFLGNDFNNLVASYDSNLNKVLLVYRDGNTSNRGAAVVGTVSGTTISFGSQALFTADTPARPNVCFDSNANKFLIVYDDGGDSNKGKSVVATISGTSVSFGSEVTFHDAGTDWIGTSFDSDENKILVVYEDTADSNKGKAVVGTISGTSVSYGSEVEIGNSSATLAEIGVVYDTNLDAHVITFRPDSSTRTLETIAAQVSGTTATFSSSVSLTNSVSDEIAFPIFDPDTNKVILAYRDENDSGKGKAIVLSPGLGSNITSENFIGIARSGAASGAGAIIDTQGAIADNLSGLTAGQSYFVQGDGTLGTTAASPSVFAGTAVSATKLIVKG
jgi:hypothetical protein